MIKHCFPVLILGRWRWVTHISSHANKYAALREYTERQAAAGIKVQGHDMSQAWQEWI